MSSVVRLLRAPLLADAPYAYAATAPADAVLGYDDQLVEFEAVAALPADRA